MILKKTQVNETYPIQSWIGRLNVIQIVIIPKAINRFNAFLIRIPLAVFIEVEKNPKMYMRLQNTLNSQSNPEKEQSGRHQTP